MLSLLLAVVLGFSSEDALMAYGTARDLVDNCTPRDAGTIRAGIAANHLLDVASATGANVRRDRFKAMTPKGELNFVNLYAEFKHGGDTSKWVVVISHYDTKPDTGCPGANDGASTSGLLVGIARAVESWTEPRGNLLLVWTDGEECFGDHYAENNGFWGSKRALKYVQDKQYPVKAVICVDMLGDKDLAITVPANGTPALKKSAQEAARRAGYPDLVKSADLIVKDDHVAFLEAGFPAIDLIDFSYGPDNSYWHTPKDTMDNISEASLLKSGKVVVELLNILL